MKPFDSETVEPEYQRRRKVFGQKIYVSALERGTRDRSARPKRIEPLPDRIEVKICPQENYRGRMKYNRTRSIPELCRITLTPTGDNHLHREQMEEVYISQYTHCFDGKIEKPHIVAWKQDLERCHVNHRDSKLCILNSSVGSKSQDFPDRPKSAPPGSFLFDFEKMDIPEPLSRRSTSPGMLIENWMGIDERDYHMENDIKTFRPLTKEKMSVQSEAPDESLSSRLLDETFERKFHDGPKQDLTQQARSLISTLRSSVKPPDDLRKTCLRSIPVPQAIKTIPVTQSTEPSNLTRREVQVKDHSETTFLPTSTEEMTDKTSKRTKVDRKKTESTLSERLWDLIGDLEPNDRLSAFKVTQEAKKGRKRKDPPPVAAKSWKNVKNMKFLRSSASAPRKEHLHGRIFEEKQENKVASDEIFQEFDETMKVQVPEAEVMNQSSEHQKGNKGKDEDQSQPSDIYSKATTLSSGSRRRRSSLSSQASYKKKLTRAWIEQQRLNIGRDFLDSKEQRLRRTKSADLQIEGLSVKEEKQESRLKHSKSELSFDQLKATYDPFDEPDSVQKSSNKNKARVLHTTEPAVITKARSFEHQLHQVTYPRSQMGPTNQTKSFECLTDNGTPPSGAEEKRIRTFQEISTEETSIQATFKVSSKETGSKENSKKSQTTWPAVNDATVPRMTKSATSTSPRKRIQAKHVEKRKVIPSKNMDSMMFASVVQTTRNAITATPTTHSVLVQNSGRREKIMDVNESKAKGTNSSREQQINESLQGTKLRSQNNGDAIQKLTARYIKEKEAKIHRVSSSADGQTVDNNNKTWSKTSDKPVVDSAQVRKNGHGILVMAKDGGILTSEEQVKIRKTKSEPSLAKELMFPGNAEKDIEEERNKKEHQNTSKVVVKTYQCATRVVSGSDKETKALIEDKEHGYIIGSPNDRSTITSEERNTGEENHKDIVNHSNITSEERSRTNSKTGLSPKISSLYPKFKQFKKKLMKNRNMEENGASENGNDEPDFGQEVPKSDQSTKRFISKETAVKTETTAIEDEIDEKKNHDIIYAAKLQENIPEVSEVPVSTQIDLGVEKQYPNFHNAVPGHKETQNTTGSRKLTKVTIVSSDTWLHEDMKNKRSDSNDSNNDKYKTIGSENITKVKKVSGETPYVKNMRNNGEDSVTSTILSPNASLNNNNDVKKTTENGMVSRQTYCDEDPTIKSQKSGLVTAKISMINAGVTPVRENMTNGERSPTLKNFEEKDHETLHKLSKKKQDKKKNEIGTRMKGFITKVLPFNNNDKRPKDDQDGNDTEEKDTHTRKEMKNEMESFNEKTTAKAGVLVRASDSFGIVNTEADSTRAVRISTLSSDKQQLKHFPEKKDRHIKSGVKVIAMTTVSNGRQDGDMSAKASRSGNATRAMVDFTPQPEHSGGFARRKTIVQREREWNSERTKNEREKNFGGLTQPGKNANFIPENQSERRQVSVVEKTLDGSKHSTHDATVTPDYVGSAGTDAVEEKTITKTDLEVNFEALDSVFTFLNSAVQDEEEKRTKTLGKVSVFVPQTEADRSRCTEKWEGEDTPKEKTMELGRIVGYRVESKGDSSFVNSISPARRGTAGRVEQETQGYGRTGGCTSDQREQSTFLTQTNERKVVEEGKTLNVEYKDKRANGHGYERSSYGPIKNFTKDHTENNSVLINTNQEKSAVSDNRSSEGKKNAVESKRDEEKFGHGRIKGAMIHAERENTILIPAVSMTEMVSGLNPKLINVEKETTTVNKQDTVSYEEKQPVDYRENRHGVTAFLTTYEDAGKKQHMKYVEKVTITRSRGASEVRREVRGQEETGTTKNAENAIKSDFLQDDRTKRTTNLMRSGDWSQKVNGKGIQNQSSGYETPTSSSIKASSDDELLQLIEDQIELENNKEKISSEKSEGTESDTTPVPENEPKGNRSSVSGKIIERTENSTQKGLFVSQSSTSIFVDGMNTKVTQVDPSVNDKGCFTSDKHPSRAIDQSFLERVQNSSSSLVNANSSEYSKVHKKHGLSSSAEVTHKQDQVLTHSYPSQDSEVKSQSTKKSTKTRTKYFTKKRKQLKSQSSDDLSLRLQKLHTDESSDADTTSFPLNQDMASPIQSFSEDSEFDIHGHSKISQNMPSVMNIPKEQQKFRSLERQKRSAKHAAMSVSSQTSPNEYSSDDDFYPNSPSQDYRIYSKTL